jgi:hypothetical protein
MRPFVLVAALLLAIPSFSQQSANAVRFNIPVVPEAAKHLEILTVPGYLALALENNGFHPSVSSRLIVKDRESFQIRVGFVRYKGRKGDLYSYDTGVNLSLGVTDTEITVPVEVDTSSVSTGTLSVRAYPPLASFLPNEFLERVQLKISLLANLSSQRTMLAYFDRLAKEQQAKGRGFEGMLEAIALEAYNNSSGPGAGPRRDRGAAEPLSDQIILLATLAIWLIGFPIFLLFVRRRRKARQPAQSV